MKHSHLSTRTCLLFHRAHQVCLTVCSRKDRYTVHILQKYFKSAGHNGKDQNVSRLSPHHIPLTWKANSYLQLSYTVRFQCCASCQRKSKFPECFMSQVHPAVVSQALYPPGPQMIKVSVILRNPYKNTRHNSKASPLTKSLWNFSNHWVLHNIHSLPSLTISQDCLKDSKYM